MFKVESGHLPDIEMFQFPLQYNAWIPIVRMSEFLLQGGLQDYIEIYKLHVHIVGLQ